MNEFEDNTEEVEEFHNVALGRKGEDAAARYLELRGYEILERNWQCPFGEADIIAMDGSTLVFVEVKTRSGIEYGFPEEAVTKEKRRRYEKISACYLKESDYVDIAFRFDVIGLLVLDGSRASLKHHINAYGAD